MPSADGRSPRLAILYARVSTEAQARNGALERQLEALRAFARREGYDILAETADAGWGGASPERPGMNRAWGLVSRGGVEAVRAVSRDRFSRDEADLPHLEEQFGAHGCALIGLRELEAGSE